MTSIYVSVPNCLDSEYYKTLNDIFANSDNPNNIYVGTAHSIPFKNKKSISEIKNKTSDYSNVRSKFLNHYRNIGVGYGRTESMSMYDGEDYILQIDSHTMLKPSWDSLLIEYYGEAKEYSKNSKTILSAYLTKYKYFDKDVRDFYDDVLPSYPCFINEEEMPQFDPDFDFSKNWKEIYSPITRWITVFEDSFYDFIKTKFCPLRKINANFIFSDGQLAEDYSKIIPFPFYFFEEEFIMSIEAHNLDYSFVYPKFKLPLAHLYNDSRNEFYSREQSIKHTNNQILFLAQQNIINYFNKNSSKIESYAKYAGLTYPELKSESIFYIPERQSCKKLNLYQ